MLVQSFRSCGKINQYESNAVGLYAFYPRGNFITERSDPIHTILFDAPHSQSIDEYGGHQTMVLGEGYRGLSAAILI
jgi:hypothetical protein